MGLKEGNEGNEESKSRMRFVSEKFGQIWESPKQEVDQEKGGKHPRGYG